MKAGERGGGESVTRDAKNIAIGVFLALVAFRIFEMVLRSFEGGMDLPVLLVIVLALVAVALVASSRSGKLKLRR